MRLDLCGVRGSTAAPGADFARTGGHTSCVAVTFDGDHTPRLLLDAGTGIRNVAPLLDGGSFHGTILLTHLHWDHWQGIPFFGPGDRDDSDVRVIVPAGDEPAIEVMRRAMSPPHFPIGPEGLRGSWRFEGIEPGAIQVAHREVRVFEVCHKGGRTYGCRVTDGDVSIAYVPDHSPAADGPGRAAVIDACRGVDVLLHDAQYVDGEEVTARAFGHATVSETLTLASEARARRLVLFHHDPGRTDEAVDRIEARLNHIDVGGVEVVMGREGDRLIV